MVNGKEVVANFELLKEGIDRTSAWAVVSFFRWALVLISTAAGGLIAFVAFFNYLILDSQAEQRAKLEPYAQAVEDEPLLLALDAISNCIEAKKDKLKDVKIYCDKAQDSYRSIQHPRMPAADLEERTRAVAVLSWRGDINAIIRSKHQAALLNIPDSFGKKLRALVFTWWGLSLSYVAAFIPTFVLMFAMNRKAKQNRFILN